MKEQIIPCTEEEMNALLDAASEKEFLYMLFYLAKTTGRRLGEFYGVEGKIQKGVKVVGKQQVFDREGNKIFIDKVIPLYKKTNEWSYGVQVKDIDFERKIMKVWVLKRRQFVQDETLLNDNAVRLLKNYIRNNKLNLEDYVFRKLSYRQIQNRVDHYAKKAGIKHKVSFHNFRHFFITQMIRHGWSHDQVAKLTGHKSIGTLSLYDHVVAEDLRDKAMQVINEM